MTLLPLLEEGRGELAENDADKHHQTNPAEGEAPLPQVLLEIKHTHCP